MAEPLRTQLDDFDFAGEMKNLANQAEAKASGGVRLDRNDLLLALGQMLRPLAFELESVKRQNAEMATALTALGKSANAQQSAAPAAQAIDNISQQLQRIGSVESANQKLFDALHAELKGYKDNFLFDALQKPFIRDLVSLFDDFTAVHEQALARLEKLRAAAANKADKPGKNDNGKRDARDASGDEGEQAFLQNLAGNVENQLHHMIEVFLRMDVVLSRTATGAPVDKKTHRTVSFEPAAAQDDDNQVARSVKPGFSWRERTIRPEEIIARRWKPATPPTANPPATNTIPSDVPAANSDAPAKSAPDASATLP